jgi:IclR family KDG regulon transcriptional repressor
VFHICQQKLKKEALYDKVLVIDQQARFYRMREIQSLSRGLQLLNIIAEAGEAQGVSDLAQQIGIDKSSVSRLLKTMEGFGYVQQEKQSRRYIIGKHFHSLAWQLVNRYSLREKAKPYIHRLAYATGECAHIGVYSAGKVQVTDDVQPETSLLRVAGTSGRLIHLHNTALGKGLIAFGYYPLPQDMPRITPRTITDTEALLVHLEEIRKLGYALDDEENEHGVRCLAAPVYNDAGIAIAMLGISGPTIRMAYENLAEYAPLVKEAALSLSCELGYQGT